MSCLLVNFCYCVFVFPFPLIGREKNLLKAPQTKQPFNKMHLIFLVFALVKWGIGFVRAQRGGMLIPAGLWTLTPYQSLSAFKQDSSGAKLSGPVRLNIDLFCKLVMYQMRVPVLRLGSTRVHVISITGLSCSQISHRSKGLCEVCHHQPINAHEYSCSVCKVKTKHFSQLNASTFFPPLQPSFLGNYSALWEGFVIHTLDIA